MMKIVKTADGSTTVESDLFKGQLYHSIKGAMGESEHVYTRFIESDCRVLEIGFGTGLNALLSLRRGFTVEYTTVELYPIEDDSLLKELSFYCDELQAMHSAPWDEWVNISENFRFRKLRVDISKACKLPCEEFDLVFFDAFAPDEVPEQWRVRVFEHIARRMTIGSKLLTYSAKGDVKRALRAAGLEVKRLPGALGKHNMLKAIKADESVDSIWRRRAADVAHDIKNPLGAILLKIETLKYYKENDPDLYLAKVESALDVVVEQSRVLCDIVENFSRSYTKSEGEDAEMGKIIRGVVDLHEGYKGVNFEMDDQSEGELNVSGNYHSLYRVLCNIVKNAIEAVGESGDIHIKLHKDKHFAHVEICNSGGEISSEDLEKIFERGYSTKDRDSGHGLSISREVIEECGGSIEVEGTSHLGGAKFVVKVPLA